MRTFALMKHPLSLLPAVGIIFSFALNAAEFDAATAINQVGLDIYGRLAATKSAQNLMVSPYSIESALALAYAGAEGKTRDEMSAVLHFPQDEAAVHDAFAALRASLAKLSADSVKLAGTRHRDISQVYTVIDGKRVELAAEPEPVFGIEWHEANRLFAQNDYAFRKPFLALMRDNYAAPLEPLDFRHDAEKGRAAINQWVEDQTQRKIHDLIPPNGVDADTRLVLVNALYLKAPWDAPFEKTLTTPEPFHVTASATRSVPTMRHGGYLGYAHENNLTVVALDYLGRELRFLILLPDAGSSVDALAATLRSTDFSRWTNLGRDGQSALVALHLPRFRIEGATLSLDATLRQLGMRSAFDEPVGSANFDRIAPRQPNDYLKFSKVFHRTFIALDEEGTEAAAATAVAMGYTAGSVRQTPVEVRVDRPFLFVIQHRDSGACLFLGRVNDPR